MRLFFSPRANVDQAITKTMRRIRAVGVFVGLIVVSVVIIHVVRNHPSVEDGFRGLSAELAKGNQIRLVIVHGIGTHCIGYGRRFIEGLGDILQLRKRDHGLKDEDFECTSHSWKEQLDICQNRIGPRKCKVLRFPRPPVHDLTAPPHQDSYVYGFLRLQRYDRVGPGGKADARPDLILYELTWDLNTAWAEQYFLDDDASNTVGRSLLNGWIKQVFLTEGFSDAVMYLGAYRPHMVAPIYETLCWILEEDPFDKTLTRCPINSLLSRAARLGPLMADFGQHSRVYFVTHSLGSRLVYDAIAKIVRGDQDRETVEISKILGLPTINVDPTGHGRDLTAVRRLAQVLVLKIGTIYMLANQVPLLEMGSIVNRNESLNLGELNSFRISKHLNDLRTEAYIRLVTELNTEIETNVESFRSIRSDRGFGKLLPLDAEDKYALSIANLRIAKKTLLDAFSEIAEERYGLDVVAFSDPDDLLSYRISANLQERAMSGVRIINVLIRTGVDLVPGVLSDPLTAHSGYFGSSTIYQFIACGASGNLGIGPQINRCGLLLVESSVDTVLGFA